jgi:hypothetical protein
MMEFMTMSNVVYLYNRINRKLGEINGVVVEHPQTCYEYLLLCKRFLTDNDYREVLCAIMDLDYYNKAEKQIQKVVDAYREFRV